ncbi:dynactin subunit 3-like [Trematomus bernacchii]|uniref:dynactin subunit 3-like n=1 Tax=Trematomus bernacchii TaxID=40690 RepID=UPI00146EA02D|nr:dynactin subunit 3-like [Trematomus bernacchii]
MEIAGSGMMGIDGCGMMGVDGSGMMGMEGSGMMGVMAEGFALHKARSKSVFCESDHVYRRCVAVEDLLKYLDPQFTDHITVPDAMKLEFILAEEDFLLTQAALLEQVSTLQPLLDSNYIRDVPEHATKLQRLSQIHIKEQDQTEAQSLEVKKLFEEYNKMMFLLSKQFTQWDETLRNLEEAKGIRPVE